MLMRWLADLFKIPTILDRNVEEYSEGVYVPELEECRELIEKILEEQKQEKK